MVRDEIKAMVQRAGVIFRIEEYRGEISFPEALRNLSPEEQLGKLIVKEHSLETEYRNGVSDYTSETFTDYPLWKYKNIQSVLFRNGVLVGLRIKNSDDETVAIFPDETVKTYAGSHSKGGNGAEVEVYATLVRIP